MNIISTFKFPAQIQTNGNPQELWWENGPYVISIPKESREEQPSKNSWDDFEGFVDGAGI